MEKKRVSELDIRIVVSASICILTAMILNMLHFRFTYGQMSLEIIQKMTAAITCLLCCQDDTKVSWKSGINRLLITIIGGLVGVGVIILDGLLQNEFVFVLLIAGGLLLTLKFCKLAGVAYVTARIGGVTFILVTCTLSGTARIVYAIFRLISTAYGVIIAWLVTWLFQKLCRR